MLRIDINNHQAERILKHTAFILCIACLLFMTAAPLFSGGGGGLIYGGHFYLPPYANYNLMASYFGGLGYGTTWSGQKIGGFGIAILDNSGSYGGGYSYKGGFGGFLAGQEFSAGPFLFSINLMTGLGGVGANFGSTRAFFGMFIEGDVEAGFTFLPWMQVAVFVGFQTISNLIPGLPFFGNLMYTPTFGVKILWGAF